jgi:hypothetical protein
VEFLVEGAPRRIDIASLVIAGWTGRDKAAVEHHIAELAAIGVKRPRIVPCFYRVGANLLTTTGEVEVAGEDSSGEVEFVLVSGPEGLYVGVGSDHTDRKVRHRFQADVPQADGKGAVVPRGGRRTLG